MHERVLSTDRSCRAAREIKHPHGEYVGRAASVLARVQTPGSSRLCFGGCDDCRIIDFYRFNTAIWRGSG